MYRRVILLGHMEFPGVQFEQCYFAKRNIITHLYRPPLGEMPPDNLEYFDGLIIGGGKVNVTDAQYLSWLKKEMCWVERFLKTGKPVMGICLGVGILAQVYGGRVYTGDKGFEYGFQTIEVVVDDPIFGNELHQKCVFQLHQQSYDLPKCAANLASSTMYEQQAARFDAHVYGTQFHPEITLQRLMLLHQQFADLAGYKGCPKAVMEEAKHHVPFIHQWFEQMLDKLFACDGNVFTKEEARYLETCW